MALRRRGIPLRVRRRCHPGPGGVWPARVGHRRHLHHAAQPDQSGRPDVARRLAGLGAGAPAYPEHAHRGPQPGPSAVGLLRPRHRSRRSRLDGGQRPRGRTGAARRQRRRTVPVTVGSIDHSNVQWRAMTVRGVRGELTTVAIDLSDVSSTVRALTWSQAGIGAAVLLVLGIAGYAVVHRSLRPLVEVEQTAAAIAAGELDRRIPQRDPRAESVDCRWRSTECLPGSSGRSHRRSRRPSRREPQRTGCAGSSPTPATSCAHR